MNRRTTFSLTTMALLCLAVAVPPGDVIAQQKQQVSFKAAADNSKYGIQQNIDVGDVPNHIVRIFEVHRTFPNNAPVINGVKLAESWTRGDGDRIDGVGPVMQYVVYVMENGDKFFARMDGVVQTGAASFTATIAGNITGGTGKFAAIQGIVREVANFDPKTGFNEDQTDIEYSIGK
jgi:hypothetical protein